MTPSQSEWIARLEQCADSPEARKPLLAIAPEGAAAAIQTRLVALLYSDRASARRMQQAGLELAAASEGRDSLARAYALRGSAHVAYVEGAYAQAAADYEEAARLFREKGEWSECARTQSSGLQSLILLSRYEQAHQWAAEAEDAFLRSGDVLRLARLDSNVGNIYFRQDRARDAVARYRRALDGFRSAGDPKDIAAVLSNLAVALTNLGEFNEALATYSEARDHCAQHGFAQMGAQADYNIAYLFFLRGDYAEARRLYQISRQHCEDAGDAYHLALCDLDEAEMCLELNLTHEGETLAKRAASRFDDLGMRYERAKALVSLAVAGSQRSEFREADRVLRHARELFEVEGNHVWPALIDLLRAVLAFHAGRFATAVQLSSLAWRTLGNTQMPGRAAHCQILRGRLWLREGQADRARATSRDALARLGDDAPPSLRFHAKLLEGEAEESQDRWREALACYEAARHEIEDLRGRLDTEDLRISILKDKLAVYDGLVSLHLESPLASRPGSIEQALLFVQQAKSRNLADRLLEIGPAPNSAAGEDRDSPAMDSLRQDLNWCYRQIELAVLMERAGNPLAPVSELRAKARAIEAELLHLRAGTPPAANAGSDERGTLLRPAESAEVLRAAIPEGSVLLEYFECRGRLYLFLISRGEVRLARLGSMSPIRHALKLLQFQLGKYRTSPDGSAMVAGLTAARHHLDALHDSLLGPARDHLQKFDRWIIAPHRHLHGIPFAALEQDGESLLDHVELVYTPSASVYAACVSRPDAPESGAWVMAVPDPRNPDIVREAEMVASLLPDAKLVLGEAATMRAFREAASYCSVLHLAAHGIFRRDNPMFSSIQLSDGRLSLFDLSRANLNVGLVTLSACNTGSAVSVGGDELLGLMRGFLVAGARNLLVSLWEVDDKSTSEFMAAFYRYLAQRGSPAAALRLAAKDIRKERPHPYFWAPFILVGV